MMDLRPFQRRLDVPTRGRGFVDITGQVRAVVRDASVAGGTCHVFLHHTSASVLLCENGDPQVQRDLLAYLERLAPDGDALFQHTAEGPDDMPAHVRSVLCGASLTVPVSAGGELDLGTWQGIFVVEHRVAPHARRLTVTVLGAR